MQESHREELAAKSEKRSEADGLGREISIPPEPPAAAATGRAERAPEEIGTQAWYSGIRAFALRGVRANEFALIAILIGLSVLIGSQNDAFWTERNLSNIARSASFTLIVAVGMTFVLISGSLDLSVGSIYGLGGATAGLVVSGGAPIWLAVFVGLLTGVLAGLINGVLVVALRVPALIATLGTLYAGRGLILVLTGGAPVFPLPDAIVAIGRGELLGVPLPVWIAGSGVLAGHVFLSRSVFGRRVYAIGNNETAAYLAGVPIRRIRLVVFAISGTAAALGGMLVAARLASAQPTSGIGLELIVIAAVIIGGTSLFGGTGSVVGTLVGVLLMEVISNGMVLVEINPFYQNIVIGVIIIIAVAIDGWRRRQLAD